jgi:molybdopterin-guanine dinucleotide biosynthesis protein A
MTAKSKDLPELRGLVLAGGKSSRMGLRKEQMFYHAVPQWQHCRTVLGTVCRQVFISARQHGVFAGEDEIIIDRFEAEGPMTGIASAFALFPESAWFVLACDLPNFCVQATELLASLRHADFAATTFVDERGQPEPLCAIYEPAMAEPIVQAIAAGKFSPRALLGRMPLQRVIAANPRWLHNINTPSELLFYKEQR